MSGIVSGSMGVSLDRRSFLAATTASLAGLTLAGCSPKGNAVTDAEEGEESTAFESDGKWVSAACWLNCGGKCYNAAYVVDGVVEYQKTDDTHEDSIEMPQQRACPRGRSLRHVVYAPDRIRYPMKRKGWSLEDPNGEMRGKDEWERISWDEALDYVAAALKKAIEQDGNRSIVYPGWTFQHTFGGNILPGLGGCTLLNDTSSYGTYNRACSMLGHNAGGDANDRYDLVNADYIVLYACNPAWASPGAPSLYFKQAKDTGVSFVYVGPSYNETADLLDARWIPVRPGTDTAFMLSVAYEMIKLDEDRGNVIDWDFLDRCTVGFDAEHMPEDAVLDENFMDYVLGKYDGVPKTAEWASEICGTPVEDIRWYAETMGKENAVSVLHSMAVARCNDADDIPQLFMTIGAMGGHVGKPGHSTGAAYSQSAGNNGFDIVSAGATGIQSLPNPVGDVIDAPDLWQAILDGKYRYCNGAMSDPSTVEDREIKIRVFYNMWRNGLQTIQGIATGIEALRTLDCVIHQGYDFNLTARYADILLPTQTQWERFSPYFFLTSKGREFQIYPNKVIEPLWEAKSDEEIGIALLERFGVDPATVLPISEEQQYFNLIAGSTVLAEDGATEEPLVTITQEDLDRLGFEGKPQEGKISFDDLMEQGIYQVPRKEGDNFGHVALVAFREDPEANPVNSKSGKMEIYCQTKADGINAMGRSVIKPYPSYRPALHGYEESFADWEGKVKGDYPFQMYNPHYLRRAHTGFDNVPQLREALPNCVFLNAEDAAEKGIEEGDAVRIWNGYGQCLRHATLSHRLMPGCVALPHGTWCDLNDDESMDRSGSDNWMLAPDTSGLGVSGYNTNLVNYEKWSGEDLADDKDRVFGPVGGIE
ncbi:molybdopterin-dependent oxidoreductase [Raoultibacter massiliensis]|uniref:molybdopterin-dependent oxidoreductase n=1 Tax=Raoultibacter massiliensis TaxID=1852371 RepID=UPI000C8499D4|nr:molybdopterin-dependent oxidoreductase [Raoultibacter massiliensis]